MLAKEIGEYASDGSKWEYGGKKDTRRTFPRSLDLFSSWCLVSVGILCDALMVPPHGLFRHEGQWQPDKNDCASNRRMGDKVILYPF